MAMPEVRSLLNTAKVQAGKTAARVVDTVGPKLKPKVTSLKEEAAHVTDKLDGRLSQYSSYTKGKTKTTEFSKKWLEKPQVQAAIKQVKEWIASIKNYAQTFIANGREAGKTAEK